MSRLKVDTTGRRQDSEDFFFQEEGLPHTPVAPGQDFKRFGSRSGRVDSMRGNPPGLDRVGTAGRSSQEAGLPEQTLIGLPRGPPGLIVDPTANTVLQPSRSMSVGRRRTSRTADGAVTLEDVPVALPPATSGHPGAAAGPATHQDMPVAGSRYRQLPRKAAWFMLLGLLVVVGTAVALGVVLGEYPGA